MTAPATVRVGESVYTVTVDSAAMNQVCDEQKDLLGSSDHRHARITLEPDQSPGVARDTLLHECLHAVAVVTDLARTWDDDEEAIVCRLTPALLALLRDNPDLLTHLTEDP